MARRPNRWFELCQALLADDGLPTRSSGTWAEDKLYFWNRYIEITTKAMVGKPSWPGGLVYVDLFAGPGICEIRETGKRIPGSPLIAVNAPKAFTRIFLVELDADLASACRARVASCPNGRNCVVLNDDCNVAVSTIVKQIPAGALTVAFIDPEGLQIHMSTIRALSARGAVDLLILFPDAMDVARNLDTYFSEGNTQLDRVFGTSDWRTRWAELGDSGGAALRNFLAKEYQDQLRVQAGYSHFRQHPIRGPRGPLYKLVYATKHEMGVKFWDESVAKNLKGGRPLF